MSLLPPAAKNLFSSQVNQQPGLMVGTDIDDLVIYKVKSIIDSYILQG